VAFLYPRLSPEDEQRFYASEFEKYMAGRSGTPDEWSGPQRHVETNQPQLQRRMAVMGNRLEAGMHVLEIGCSSGYMLYPLRERGLHVVGIEPSGLFSNFVRSHGVEVFAGLEELEQESPWCGRFDLAMHFFVLEHVGDPAGFLKACLNTVRPGGRVFFEVPSRSDPLLSIYDIAAFRDFYWQVAHQWYFNERSLRVLLDQLPCAYEIVPEQRYDLSNHIWWALTGRPGGTQKFSQQFTPELEAAYVESMCRTGHYDGFLVWLYKRV
jgi:2-polyprenyl-3-methyl-5-hydroxy-6-metoxy-1,4-benzoquinol methylase